MNGLDIFTLREGETLERQYRKREGLKENPWRPVELVEVIDTLASGLDVPATILPRMREGEIFVSPLSNWRLVTAEV